MSAEIVVLDPSSENSGAFQIRPTKKDARLSHDYFEIPVALRERPTAVPGHPSLKPPNLNNAISVESEFRVPARMRGCWSAPSLGQT